MERERPRPRDPEEEHEAPAEIVEPPRQSAGPRCPYCHEDQVHGELASDCARCHTLHHVACFAENRGCATHACGGHRALSVVVGRASHGPGSISCVRCKKAIEANTLVARCKCSRILDADCYGEVKNCTWAQCNGPIELMSHSEALAANKLRTGRILARLACLPGGLSLLMLFISTLESTSRQDKAELPYVAAAFFVFVVPLLLGSLKMRMDAKRLAALPPPRPGGAPPPPAGGEDEGKGPKKAAKPG